MTRPALGTVLLGVLTFWAVPARGQCDPSHAVVAVASILSTLALVTVVLVGVYCFIRHGRPGHGRSQDRQKYRSRKGGHVNHSFGYGEDFVPQDNGVIHPKSRAQSQPAGQVLSRRHSKTESWATPPRSEKAGRWHRDGWHGSLDGALNCMDSEIITVELESQDIIGLGFNIYGNYGDGIRVSEVNNRGPAKESGEIQAGDRILSVTVSYQNIIYEDALTILSYASPYPVKIVLEKAAVDSEKNFVNEPPTGHHTKRITHPLYRSRSVDTLKSVAQIETSVHSKRAVSDLKMESVKYFFNWRSKSSKKGSVISKNDRSTLSEQFRLKNSRSASDMESFAGRQDVLPEGGEEKPFSSFVISDVKNSGNFKKGSTTYQIMADVTPTSEVNRVDEYNHQKIPPAKPERKTSVHSLEDNKVAANLTAFTYSMPISAVTDDEIDVDEMLIFPETWPNSAINDMYISEHTGDLDGNINNYDEPLDIYISKNAEESNGNIENYDRYLELDQIFNFDDYRNSANETEAGFKQTSNRPEASFVTSSQSNDLSFSKQDSSKNNSEIIGEHQTSSALDEETINRIIATNDFTPVTQGWTRVQAEEPIEETMNDFIPDQPLFIAEHVKSSSTSLDTRQEKIPETSEHPLDIQVEPSQLETVNFDVSTNDVVTLSFDKSSHSPSQ